MSRKNFLKEQKILSKTVQKIKEKIYLIMQSSKKYIENVRSNNYLPGVGISHRRAMLDKVSLKDTLSEPYFGKIDIHTDQDGIEHYYIDNQGVIDRNQNTIVVDWRRPFATVFYNFTPGQPMQEYNVVDKGEVINHSVRV